MLPVFPKFKKIQPSDKAGIEKITSRFPPYSDFNFLSMWCWDIKRQIRVSTLHGNLVVRFTDYLTGESFYSFLGKTRVNETAEALLELSKKEKLKPVLELVPEVAVKKLDHGKFNIEEDRDHFDYVYTIRKLAHYVGSEYSKHRKLARHFEKNSFEVDIVDLTKPANRRKISKVVESWAGGKQPGQGEAGEDFANELLAFRRLLASPPKMLSTLVCLCLFVDGSLAGFIINEKVGSKYCIAHFGKAQNSYKGINHHMLQKNARIFLDLGISYLNDQQDLGLPGLRYSKSSYNPAHFLKKYSLRLKK